MAWLPIDGIVPQYTDSSGNPYSGAVLKAYAVNSTTNISFAVDAVASATAASIALNASGYPEVSGNVVIPHLDQNYKLCLYPTQAAANADSGAIWSVDNIELAGLPDATDPAATTDINIWPITSYGGAKFDGANDYMLRGAGLTGAADGKKGTLVAFVTFDAASAAIEYIITNTGIALALRRNTDGTFTVLAENSGGSVILSISTEDSYDATDTVYCIMASWDLATTGSQQLYVNDVADLITTTFTNDTIDYTVADWSIGADVSGATKFAGNMYGLWLDTTNNLNFDVESNRRRFLDDSDRPVFLGTRGEIPTGTKPILYLGNDSGGSYQSNHGTGGDFTVTGSLGTATVSLEGQYGKLGPALVAAQDLSSGSPTDATFTWIPSWATRVTMFLLGVSASAGNNWRIQIGDLSGGMQTSGYVGTYSRLINATAPDVTGSTAGWELQVGAAAAVVSGSIVMELADASTNTWTCRGQCHRSDSAQVLSCGGYISLSGALDRCRLVRTSTDTFDAGKVSIRIE